MILLQRGIYNSARHASLNGATALGAGVAAAVPHYDFASMPPGFTWEVQLTGGPPASVQIDFEGSMDGTNWYQLDTTSTTASGIYHVIYKKANFVRANLKAIGAGGGSYIVYIDVT